MNFNAKHKFLGFTYHNLLLYRQVLRVVLFRFSSELSRLWNICPDNLEACRLKSRDFMPQLDAFFAEAFIEIEAEPTPISVLVDPSKKEFKAKKYVKNVFYFPIIFFMALKYLKSNINYIVFTTSFYRILGDPMFGWKALRLLARRSPYFFQMFGGAPISPLQNYLEYVLKKINADREPPLQNSQDDPQMVLRLLCVCFLYK